MAPNKMSDCKESKYINVADPSEDIIYIYIYEM